MHASAHLHLLVDSVVKEQVVGHAHAMGLHGVTLQQIGEGEWRGEMERIRGGSRVSVRLLSGRRRKTFNGGGGVGA